MSIVLNNTDINSVLSFSGSTVTSSGAFRTPKFSLHEKGYNLT